MGKKIQKVKKLVYQTRDVSKQSRELGKLEYYEPMPNVVVTNIRNIVGVVMHAARNWGQRASLFPVFLGMKCCAIEMGATLRDIYDQMPQPKWVFTTGECSISGGPFWQSPTILEGTDQVIPVDVFVPGCPPRPEAMWAGLLRLQEKIREDGVFVPEPLRDIPREFYQRDDPLIDLRLRPKLKKKEITE
jgi:NADH:ubiquinone oxidoreductase subunit B-like Fe-S oxidoreductase